MNPQLKVLLEIVKERQRQDAKFGSQRNHAGVEWLAILTEEVGEVAKEAVELNWPNFAKNPSKEALKKELIQVAAVAVCWLESLEDQKAEPVFRDYLGEQVRNIWIKWAESQPNPKPSWLVPYQGLSEPDKEVDRMIGEWLYFLGSIKIGSLSQVKINPIPLKDDHLWKLK